MLSTLVATLLQLVQQKTDNISLPQGVESESFPVLQQSLKAGHPTDDQACNNHHFYGGEKMQHSLGGKIKVVTDFSN